MRSVQSVFPDFAVTFLAPLAFSRLRTPADKKVQPAIEC